jgi:hypothetical protein
MSTVLTQATHRIERIIYTLADRSRFAEFNVHRPLDFDDRHWCACRAFFHKDHPNIQVLHPGFLSLEQAAAMQSAISMAIDWLTEQFVPEAR